jgi:hypothetical protein
VVEGALGVPAGSCGRFLWLSASTARLKSTYLPKLSKEGSLHKTKVTRKNLKKMKTQRKYLNSQFTRLLKNPSNRRFPLLASSVGVSRQKSRDHRRPIQMWPYSKGLLTIQLITISTILIWPLSRRKWQLQNQYLKIKFLLLVVTNNSLWGKERRHIRHLLVFYRIILITYQLLPHRQFNSLYLLTELACNLLK